MELCCLALQFTISEVFRKQGLQLARLAGLQLHKQTKSILTGQLRSTCELVLAVVYFNSRINSVICAIVSAPPSP